MTKSKKLFQWCQIAVLLAAASSASALPVTISAAPGSYSVGQSVTFTVSDADPSGMCDLTGDQPFCFGGDFSVSFDPSKLSFDASTGLASPSATTFDVSVVGGVVETGGPLGAFVDVSVLFLDTSLVPTELLQLFSLTFTALAGPTAEVGVDALVHAPEALLTAYPGAYAFGEVERASVSITTIPEPASYALLLLGFAAMGGVARRKGRLAA
jgi:hypothetical protein